MTGLQIYQLILDTFAAMGTLGAVILSLWLSKGLLRKFKIKEIRVFATIDSINEPRTLYNQEIFVLIENYQSVPLHVQKIRLELADQRNKKGWKSFAIEDYVPENNIIPALSQYDVKINLDAFVPKGYLRNVEQVCIIVQTNFGRKKIKLPEGYFPIFKKIVEGEK